VDSSGATQGYFVNVIQARDQTGANLTSSVSESGTSFTVTVSHVIKGKAVATFTKEWPPPAARSDMSPIPPPRRSPAAFIAGVQGIHVSSDGPVWDP